MDYEAFMKIIRGRRSIRFYKPDPVDDETIIQIIEADKRAPSGNNTQPFEIVLVNDKDLAKRDPIIHKNRYDKDKFKNDEELAKIFNKFSAVSSSLNFEILDLLLHLVNL